MSGATIEPAASHPGRRRFADRIGIVPRLLLGIVVAVMLSVALIDGWIARSIEQSAREQAGRQLEVGLGVLKAVLHPLGTDFRLDAQGRLTLNGLDLAGRNDLVDVVRSVTGANATLFAGLTRIATTVPKPDGTRAVGTPLAAGPAQAALAAGQTYRGQNTILGRNYATIYEPLRDADGKQVGALYVGVPLAAIETEVFERQKEALLVGLGAVVVVAILGWFWVRRVVRPLLVMAEEMRAIAAGALDRPVPLTARGDQIGQMARALLLLRDTARGARLAETQAAAERARAEAEKQAALAQMAAAIEHETASAVRDAQRGGADMAGAADTIIASAAKSAGEADRAASASEHALTTAQSVAGAAEQLSASIQEITTQVSHSARIVATAVQTGREARVVFQSLTEQVGRVGTVAGMIADIAGRTNLLALNAAIEAARAGEAGRGFAVVAGEVKALATQTARSTEEIAGRITEMRGAADQAAEAMARIEASIGHIDGIAASIAASVEEQGAATAGIARDVGDTARAVREAAGCIDLVAREVRKTTEQADDVREHALGLVASVTTLRASVASALAASASDGIARAA